MNDTAKMMRTVKACGWDVALENGHYKVRNPESGDLVVVAPSTPSDHRSYLNTRADLRRHGCLSTFGVIKRAVQAVEDGWAPAPALPHEPYVTPKAPLLGDSAERMEAMERRLARNGYQPFEPSSDENTIGDGGGENEDEVRVVYVERLKLPRDRRKRVRGHKKWGRPQRWTPESICEGLATAFAFGAPSHGSTGYRAWMNDGQPVIINGETVAKGEIFPVDTTVSNIVGWADGRDYALQLLDDEEEDGP